MRHAGALGLGGLVLALLLSLGISRCQLEQLQERHAAAALRADSAIAASDTSRTLGAKAAKLLGDSLAGVERRAVQQKQRAEALDKALGRERIAKIEMTATIKALETRGTSTGGVTETRSAEDTESVVRHAVFDVRSEPYTVHAEVSLPKPPLPGALDTLRVSIDTARLSVRPGCGAAKDGIRPATVAVTGPRWLPIALTHVEQSEDLCRSPALQPRGVSRTKYFTIGAGTGIVLCFFFCPTKD